MSDYIPDVVSVAFTPSRIDPGGGLGDRGSVTVQFRDHAKVDVEDPYYRERSYYPEQRGTYWGKFLARNRFFSGQIVRVGTGYTRSAFDVGDYQYRTYTIEKIDGPTNDDRVTLTGKDILKLADDKRAQAPATNSGKLVADITAGATTATLTPTGIGATEYAASGTLRIGDEICTFTRSGDVLTLVRGTDGSTADSHSAGDVVQQCLRFTSVRVDSIISTLLTTYAGVDAGYIPTADWTAEADDWLADTNLTTLITQPTGVSALLNELCQQCLLFLWWDERAEEIKFRAVRPAFSDSITDINDTDHIIEGSAVASSKQEDRLSQVRIWYDRVDFTKDDKVAANYQRAQIQVDTDAESAVEYGSPRIKEYFSRWFNANNDGQAIQTCGRLINKYRDPPRYLTFRLDAKDSTLWTGDICRVSTRQIQDVHGDNESMLFQVLQVKEVENGSVYEYQCLQSQFSSRYALITIDAMTDYGSTSDTLREVNGFIAPDSGIFADGTKAYVIA